MILAQHPFWRLLFIGARMLLMVYVGLLVYLGIFQRRAIYYPTRTSLEQLEAVASRNGLTAWRSTEGELIGWKPVRASSSQKDRLLVFHGNAGYALHRTYLVDGFQRSINDHSFEVYLVEYPGYGAREGSPSESAFYEAARQAFLQLREDAPGSRIFVAGESLGSGVAAWLAGQFPHRISGLFLMTTFTSMTDVALHHYPYMPVRLLLRDRYETQPALSAYNGPLAVLLAGNDNVVPTRLGEALYESFHGPKRLWIQDNRSHNTLDYGMNEPWWREVRLFLLETAPPAPSLL